MSWVMRGFCLIRGDLRFCSAICHIGKPMKAGLDYDSDDKNDEEVAVATATSELIDLSGSSSTGDQRKSAAKIPKLSKP